jgi:hypothetical protein
MARKGGGRRVANGGVTSGLAWCCRLPYVRVDRRDAAAAVDSAESAGRSGAVAAAVEAGDVPKRWARGSMLREGGQGTRVHRHTGGEDRSGGLCLDTAIRRVALRRQWQQAWKRAGSVGLDDSARWRRMRGRWQLAEMHSGHLSGEAGSGNHGSDVHACGSGAGER